MIFYWFIHLYCYAVEYNSKIENRFHTHSELFFCKAYFGHCGYFLHSLEAALHEYLIPGFLDLSPQHIGFAVKHDFITQAVKEVSPHTYCPDLVST